ncbi:MAG TPA: glycosyltransferase family 4 protein [Thermomicrobiales bacterium]|nr:glycosyltransferase family 4 protein [Thermomicrobiales bacterium]
MNVLVLHTQVPFARGGAEVLVAGLVDAIGRDGHAVDVVSLPLAWNPVDRLLSSALAWRMLDLSTFNGRDVDIVICTKYPTWAVKHRNKVLWLIHQHRQVYDLYGTPLSEFGPDTNSRAVRDRVRDIDRIGIGECSRRFAISRNVRDRLAKHTGLDAGVLYPPVPREGLSAQSYDPYVLSVSRLDGAKRVEELIRSWRFVQADLKLVVAGDGPELERLRRVVERDGQSMRIELTGRVDDNRLRDLYNHCRAVYYAPVDEDYGYAAVEALAAGKPVITAPDSGGVLEFVTDNFTGVVTSLEPRELAKAIDRLADETLARRLGERGPAMTSGLVWDTVVSALLGT